MPTQVIADHTAHSRRANVLTLQSYLDQHNIARTRRAIVALVANVLIDTDNK